MFKLLVLLLFPISRFLINLNNWNFMRRVIKKHDEWLAGLGNDAPEKDKAKAQKAAEWIQENTTEIGRVFKLTGREIPVESYMDGVGYGYVQKNRLNILDNLLFQNTDILQRGRSLLHIAKGHFLANAKLSLNPLYWLEVLFFLPKSIVSASGIEVTTKMAEVGVKVAQIIYWLAIVGAFLFKPELFSFLYDHAST
ncbi:hypothetical protein [Gallaecimonas mangrovi]|uniref:hypothetical protein n=1 Tax=Gallaecimonas mangrovi TaxID=2291597 RepID=UPI000E1FD60C|nr:hypothetical protein [Gallaecimonas mangrovi]